MAASISNISFRCDSQLKKQAESLFNQLGLNMTTALTMFLSQSVRDGAIPFRIGLTKPNAETLGAMQEVEKMLEDPNTVYYDVETALKELKA